jgi:hypothetical protein
MLGYLVNIILKLMGCRMEMESPVRHFDKLSVTAAEKLCAGLAIPHQVRDKFPAGTAAGICTEADSP